MKNNLKLIITSDSLLDIRSTIIELKNCLKEINDFFNLVKKNQLIGKNMKNLSLINDLSFIKKKQLIKKKMINYRLINKFPTLFNLIKLKSKKKLFVITRAGFIFKKSRIHFIINKYNYCIVLKNEHNLKNFMNQILNLFKFSSEIKMVSL